jgi:hypothetical protein
MAVSLLPFAAPLARERVGVDFAYAVIMFGTSGTTQLAGATHVAVRWGRALTCVEFSSEGPHKIPY